MGFNSGFKGLNISEFETVFPYKPVLVIPEIPLTRRPMLQIYTCLWPGYFSQRTDCSLGLITGHGRTKSPHNTLLLISSRTPSNATVIYDTWLKTRILYWSVTNYILLSAAMAKGVFNKQKTLFTSKTFSNERKKTSEAMLLEHSFVWCWDLDTLESRSEIPRMFWNVVLEKDGKDQLDRSSEKWS